ncbi:uncharacterized protein BDZ83DRAFT_605096 [Colletotrichum acutatum]|uniref:Uncharacterized protein n=1 Tax=Glomerella acutata TaxID=27357 RepID=A0AAD8XL83_GLOAC|nr:uncharacterized protein BDZ83DRAFT_605096 [Colletotrichum acutatum]KAK1729441.1 hypothetical protein BDZ83DRAFT_605096 [Colletotrichum acutatum]
MVYILLQHYRFTAPSERANEPTDDRSGRSPFLEGPSRVFASTPNLNSRADTTMETTPWRSVLLECLLESMEGLAQSSFPAGVDPERVTICLGEIVNLIELEIIK